MGRNKYSEAEIKQIAKLLRQKCAATRFVQKQIRHKLRVEYEFNISDFGVQGQAHGEEELKESIKRGRIQILDDATIQAMKQKHQQQRQREALEQESQQIEKGEITDWRKALEEWEREENENP